MYRKGDMNEWLCIRWFIVPPIHETAFPKNVDPLQLQKVEFQGEIVVSLETKAGMERQW